MDRTGKTRAFALLMAAMCLLTGWMYTSQAQVIAWGSRGNDVKLIQQTLLKYGYFSGTVDGVFGKATYDAVVYFQRKNGLKADGVVGKSTAAALGITLSTGAVAASTQSDSDTYLLARIVHGEARGEPYMGKVAVAAVVLNRVKSPSFPNTIAGVIYQTGAFDAVADGQVNLTPDADSLRAARDALNGWDPTGGALYYFNPATATNGWIWTRQITLTIGKHNFAV